jgi:ubiquinone biosynthesis protein
MIYFVIRVLVTALALAITVILTPRLTVQPLIPGVIPINATYLLIGILFGLINAFIRPLVLLLTARLLVRTMWLFALAINAFLFWLLVLLIPGAFAIESPQLLWIALAGVIVAMVLAVMEAFIGVDMPALGSQIEQQFYWRWVGLLGGGRRNMIAENLRTAQVVDIISRYTADVAVEITPLARFRTFMRELLFRDVDPLSDLTLPEKVRLMIQELGPTFVKFGQIVSSRAQALPPEWNEQLAKLQSNVPPFSYEKARAILIQELKDTPENLYASFEKEPFAAASTAQVHRAILHDGTAVVVKIQRPNIDVTIKADLNVMVDLAKQIQRRQDWAKNINLHGLIDEFGQSILTELDYRNEATNIRLLARNMAQFEAIHIPAVYFDLSSRKVLTMEFLSGVKITDVERIEAAGLDRQALARAFVQALTKQTLFDGFFHADPHPGNALVDLETGQIGLLDMGLMGELNRMQRMALADVMVSIVENDGYSLGRAALRLSRPLPGTTVDEAAFLEGMERFGQRFLGVDESISYSFVAMEEMMQRYGLQLDPNFTLAFKTLMQSDEIIRALDPSFILTTTVVESSVPLLREQFNPEALGQMIGTQVSRSIREVTYRIPTLVEATTKWLDQYEQGRLSFHLDTSDLSPQVAELNRGLANSSDRLVMGLVMAGWLVGAAIASTVDVQVGAFQLSDLAFYMFMAGAIVGAVIVFQAGRRLNRAEADE